MASLLAIPSMLFSGEVCLLLAVGGATQATAGAAAAADLLASSPEAPPPPATAAAALAAASTFHGLGVAGALGPKAGAGVFVAAARLLAATSRHHAPAARRCMALATASARSLLAALTAWQMQRSDSANSQLAGAQLPAQPGGAAPQHKWWQPAEHGRQAQQTQLAKAAASLAAVYAAVAEHKELAKYSLHLLADYIVLSALPAAATAAAGGPMAVVGEGDGIGGIIAGSGGSSVASAAAAIEAALLPGAYGLYGACSPAEVGRRVDGATYILILASFCRLFCLVDLPSAAILSRAALSKALSAAHAFSF